MKTNLNDLIDNIIIENTTTVPTKKPGVKPGPSKPAPSKPTNPRKTPWRGPKPSQKPAPKAENVINQTKIAIYKIFQKYYKNI